MSLVPSRLSQSLSPKHISRESLAHYCPSCLVCFPRGPQKRASRQPCNWGVTLNPAQTPAHSRGWLSQQPPPYLGLSHPSLSSLIDFIFQRVQFLTVPFPKPTRGCFPHLQLYFSPLWVAHRPCMRCANLCLSLSLRALGDRPNVGHSVISPFIIQQVSAPENGDTVAQQSILGKEKMRGGVGN